MIVNSFTFLAYFPTIINSLIKTCFYRIYENDVSLVRQGILIPHVTTNIMVKTLILNYVGYPMVKTFRFMEEKLLLDYGTLH